MKPWRGSGTGLRFTRIHIENWRNFGSADVELAQRVFVVSEVS
jgi:hypothetical protein